MLLAVRLFATLRDIVGEDRLELELPDGTTVRDLWTTLALRHPDLGPRRLGLAVAVNRRYAGFDAPLASGDEVAFIPPVSGG